MSMRRRSVLAGVLTAFLTLGLTAAGIAEDGTLKLIPGATIKAAGNQLKGPIQAETPTEVRIAGQSVPLDQIDTLEYDGQPPSFLLARNRDAVGNLIDAADLYAKAATEAGAGKPLIARAAQFNRARIVSSMALADPAKVGEAVAQLEQFIRIYPNSRQLGQALETLARLQIQAGNLDKADKALVDLAKLPWATTKAAVIQAKVLGKRGKFDEAITKLDAMMSAAPAGSDRRRDTLLAKAEALGGQKKFEEAEAMAREVIKAAGPEEVETQSAAHNTLGDLLRQSGKTKDALIEFLHTDILYPKDREQHPRALAQIVELCRELKLDDQAKDASDRLRQEYPTSPYAAAVGAAK